MPLTHPLPRGGKRPGPRYGLTIRRLSAHDPLPGVWRPCRAAQDGQEARLLLPGAPPEGLRAAAHRVVATADRAPRSSAAGDAGREGNPQPALALMGWPAEVGPQALIL